MARPTSLEFIPCGSQGSGEVRAGLCRLPSVRLWQECVLAFCSGAVVVYPGPLETRTLQTESWLGGFLFCRFCMHISAMSPELAAENSEALTRTG